MSKVIKTDTVYKLDQFFTKNDVALMCCKELQSFYKLSLFDSIIEPSAGNGSFFNLLPVNKRIGIEIDAELCVKNNEYRQMSFFDYVHDDFFLENEKILVIGNPPFGTQNKLSVDFFNHAAKFAKVIAFIVPRTWNKRSIHNRLNKKFILIKSIDLPEDCFYGDKSTTVKCCFQIWKRSKKSRVSEEKILSHKDWKFLPYTKTEDDLTPPQDADFVVLAYGSNPGQVSTDLFKWRPKSVHFIKSQIDKTILAERFNTLDYSCANDSARQSSLCKGDLIRLYSEKYGN